MDELDDTIGPDRGVAVFGSSSAEPGSPAWERARLVGTALGARGVPVVSGGYGGVMEAASRGAREAGGEAIGVTSRAWRGRTPNAFLTLEIEEPDLLTRTARLFALARGFIVLGGGAGTLAELAMLWAHARAGLLPGPVVLLDDGWARLYEDLLRDGRLEPHARRATHVTSDPEQAVRLALSPACGSPGETP